jgi:hypothetical protein
MSEAGTLATVGKQATVPDNGDASKSKDIFKSGTPVTNGSLAVTGMPKMVRPIHEFWRKS